MQQTQQVPQPGTSRMQQMDNADKSAREFVLEAERFRASTEIPQGNSNLNVMNVCVDANVWSGQVNGLPNLNNPMVLPGTHMQIEPPVQGKVDNGTLGSITDDEFFHLTCQVDPNLKQKIKKGEFVELEKLLVKDRFRSVSDSAGQRMELVNKGGETYIMPVEKDNRITNVRHWEQVFRIYVAIYSQANPQRSAEIWQYVFVINSAASTYIWENVASYDYTF